MSTSLVMFAKNPIPGKVKTRLVPSITPVEAAELYKAFIVDIANSICKLNCRRITIAYTLGNAEKSLRKIVGRSVGFMPQKGRNLGERMKNAFKQSFAKGLKRVVIVGSDSPTLPISYIEKAFNVLKKVPIVIGPTFDGGYYLIGLSELDDAIFNGIKWSTSSVFDQTIKRMKSINKKLFVLPPWYDVDTSEDLEFLRSHLLAMKLSGIGDIPDKTIRFLKI
ncbi:MAG: TIGR04282 family arsenosugar biosynthesis glycosyltransferase [Candidatus Scalinduaceae bacterium]